MKFPNRIRELREAARLSQRELASRTGFSGSEVHKLETGDRRLTQRHVTVLCQFFGVSADVLMDRGEPGPPASEADRLDVLTAAVKRIERKVDALASDDPVKRAAS